MPGTPESILLDDPREADVPSIERELAGLWKTVGEGDAADGAPIRACSLNLIVLTDRRERLEATEQLIGDVSLEHPARIFLVMKESTVNGPGLDAWVSARCTVPVQGGPQVCCEQITLRTGDADSMKIPNVVASLLVPDVPSVLVWKMPLRERDPLLWHLALLVDRVIIDSSDEPDPVRTIRAWDAFMLDPERRVPGGDLAWTHLTAWRAAVAHLFDPVSMRQQLGSIEGVDVQYTVSEAPPHSGVSQALLLFSWLSARLGWTLIRQLAGTPNGQFTATATVGGHLIALSAAAAGGAEGGPGGMERIRIMCSGGWSATFASGRDHGSILTRVERGPDESSDSVLWIRDRDESAVLAGELELMVRDQIYEEAVLSMERLFGEHR